ncbi:MAG TPA: hypothetical protein EYP65_02315 [Armatimonadetes bacterium]|nr:hypothetical protein [Armatimonadota bacterium]
MEQEVKRPKNKGESAPKASKEARVSLPEFTKETASEVWDGLQPVELTVFNGEEVLKKRGWIRLVTDRGLWFDEVEVRYEQGEPRFVHHRHFFLWGAVKYLRFLTPEERKRLEADAEIVFVAEEEEEKAVEREGTSSGS